MKSVVQGNIVSRKGKGLLFKLPCLCFDESHHHSDHDIFVHAVVGL